jgi:hypothetical protein
MVLLLEYNLFREKLCTKFLISKATEERLGCFQSFVNVGEVSSSGAGVLFTAVECSKSDRRESGWDSCPGSPLAAHYHILC